MDNLNNILNKSTYIIYLNIRINKSIQVRNVREFMRNMQNIQVHTQIPINAHLEIRLNIKRCLSNHSDNWKVILKNYLLNNNKTRKFLTERKQLLLGKEEQPQDYISETHSPMILLLINTYLYQNYLTMYVQLHLESLHKFGFKKYFGKATLSENITDALLHYCDMIKGLQFGIPFVVLIRNSQIISQSSTTDVIAKELSFQREHKRIREQKIEFFQKSQIIKIIQNIQQKRPEKYVVFLKKLNIETKTKVKSIILRRAKGLYKTKKRNLNLQIIKIKEQIKKEQIELKKEEVKDKVILDKYQLKEEELEKIQKVLDEKAKKKSLKLLKQEKKRSKIIPRW